MSPTTLRRLLPLPLLACAACQGIAVDTTHDPDVDFAPLRTFGWLSVPPQARTAVQEQSLTDLIRAELSRKGVQYQAQDPALLVAVHRSVEGNLNTSGWGYEASGGRMRYYTLQEGTLVIDLVDAKSRRSVWRGTASGVFKFDDDPAAREEMLRSVVRDLFAGFPPPR